MKKILFICGLILLSQWAVAQIFGKQEPIQEEARISRIYIWDKPVADSLTYKDVIPNDMKIIVGFTSSGKGVYILAQDAVFNNIVKWFEDTAYLRESQNSVLGFEFVVGYVESFSWLTKKKINSLKGTQKSVAEAFNKNVKYTLMSQSPRTVFGNRDKEGNIVPIFTASLPYYDLRQAPVDKNQQPEIKYQRKYSPPPGWPGSGK